jgi:hypothetical protein
MHSKFASMAPRLLLRVALAAVPVILSALALVAGQRVRLEPKFVVGETLRYRIEARTTTNGKTTAPIANPEGGSKSKQIVRLLIRLDVLGNEPAIANATTAAKADAQNSVRFRATYEESSVEIDSDALDLAAASLEDSYHRIEGRSVEFTIGPDGRVGAFQGLDTIFPNPSSAGPVLAWLDTLLAPPQFPKDGIAVGQKWSSERPLVGVALTGLTWRTESEYLRDDTCSATVNPSALPDATADRPGACAVILTHFRIFRAGSAHSDATPPDYLKNGLRTSGAWTGSGDGLESVSLATGLLVTATQTSSQDVDYEIKSASTGSTIHHQGQVETQSETTLVPSQP